jgi:prevent-host-death family protein
MSGTPGDERDPLPASPGQHAKEAETATPARGRGPGRPARQAEASGHPAVGAEASGRPARRAEASGRPPVRDRIGIRKLRQEASVYVDLAEKGYTVDITNRGRLVARLVPVREPDSPLERLIAAGIVEPAEEPGGVGGLEPYPAPGQGGPR